MPQSMLLEVSHPEIAPGKIEGFRFLWAFYLNGYDPTKHCQPCFRGSRVGEFCTPTAASGRRIVLDKAHRYPFVYICGVAAGARAERRLKNLHFPLRYRAGGLAQITTYNGYTFRAHDAEQLPIPSLPDGWQGKPEPHTRCKNFQFAVAYFGHSTSASDPARG